MPYLLLNIVTLSSKYGRCFLLHMHSLVHRICNINDCKYGFFITMFYVFFHPCTSEERDRFPVVVDWYPWPVEAARSRHGCRFF